MAKTTLSSKVSEQTKQRVEKYAESKGISRSEAVDRLVRKSLKIENGDVEIVPVSADGGIATELEETQVELQNQSEQIQSQEELQRYQGLLLFLSIFWLGIHLVFSVPAVATIGTGLVLVGGLVYTHIRTRRK